MLGRVYFGPLRAGPKARAKRLEGRSGSRDLGSHPLLSDMGFAQNKNVRIFTQALYKEVFDRLVQSLIRAFFRPWKDISNACERIFKGL